MNKHSLVAMVVVGLALVGCVVEQSGSGAANDTDGNRPSGSNGGSASNGCGAVCAKVTALECSPGEGACLDECASQVGDECPDESGALLACMSGQDWTCAMGRPVPKESECKAETAALSKCKAGSGSSTSSSSSSSTGGSSSSSSGSSGTSGSSTSSSSGGSSSGTTPAKKLHDSCSCPPKSGNPSGSYYPCGGVGCPSPSTCLALTSSGKGTCEITCGNGSSCPSGTKCTPSTKQSVSSVPYSLCQ